MKLLRFIILTVLILGKLPAFSQKLEVLSDEKLIAERANHFLNSEFANGELAKKAKDLAITGEFILDITLYGKGQVLTIFSPFEIPEEQIKQQNKLKDLLMKCEFPFKLPKDKRVKFQHKFSFN